jgi:ATP-dependent DNA helicase PIF1
MANTDIHEPRTGEVGVVAYLDKYAAKAEKASDSYKGLFKIFSAAYGMPFVNEDRAVLLLISKVMNKLVGERDWSVQKVSHLLLNLPVCNSTRSVINVDCRPESEQSTAYFYEQDEDG